MPHSAIAIEYPCLNGINFKGNFRALGHSASKGEKPTGHVGPMGKAHAFAREEAKVWPWIGGEHSSGLGWLLAGFDQLGPDQVPVVRAKVFARYRAIRGLFNGGAVLYRHFTRLPIGDCLLADAKCVNDLWPNSGHIEWVHLFHAPDHTLKVYCVNYLFSRGS